MFAKFGINSHNRGSEVVRAALAGSGKYNKALAATMNASPDYAEISKTGMRAKSAVREAQTKANAIQEEAKIRADAKVDAKKTIAGAKQSRFQAAYDAYDNIIAAEKGLGQAKRKAGLLATLGGVAMYGGKLFKKDGEQAPTPMPMIDTSDTDAAIERHKAILANLPDFTKLSDAPTTPGTTSKGPGAPAATSGLTLTPDQRFALDQIASVESGKWGYDAVNQMGKAGGHVAIGSGAFGDMKQHGGRKLSSLTVGEIMELHRDDGSLTDQEWIDQGKIWATGRYQFTGPTFSGIVKQMGIDPSTRFSHELQDKMALHLGRQNLDNLGNTWIGLQKLSPEDLARVRAGLQ